MPILSILLLMLGFFFHLRYLLFKHLFMGLPLIPLKVDLHRRTTKEIIQLYSEVCLTLATCFSIVSSTASQLSPLINIERCFKNERDAKGDIIYQLKIIPGLKDVHNVANVHPSDISARNKVHLTRKITKVIDESLVIFFSERVVKRSGTVSPQKPFSSGQACHRQRLQRCRQSRGLQAPAPVDICSNGKELIIRI